MTAPQLAALRRLARLFGVQTEYCDAAQRLQEAAPEALLHVLRALGASLERISDAAGAARARRQALWQQPVEPVTVAWDGQQGTVALRLPAGHAGCVVSCQLHLETGEQQCFFANLAEVPARRAIEVEGVSYLAKRLPLPCPLPWGYHRLTMELPGAFAETLVVAAPERAYADWLGAKQKMWGVFTPLYALHRQRSWGAGDFSDLETLIDWVAGQGGNLVATLPLLASFAETTGDPSPYAPASRLFCNELYLDVTRLPELARSAAARALLAAPETERRLQALRAAPLVEHQELMTLKRRIIALLAEEFFREPREQRPAFAQFVRDCPDVEQYARFRAAGERHRLDWRKWPQPLCDGRIQPGDYDDRARQYHLYAQWQIDEQLRSLVEHARAREMIWYLDLALGVHGNSYDVWRERECFVAGISGGAPPDTFFTKGQNWDFPPLHPRRTREQGHRYFLETIRRQLRYARLLRLDHFMGMHRLYWIPQGFAAKDGVYVRYPGEELYAILTLESQRHCAGIVGENLGTVPPVVNAAMQRHGIHGMYVFQYEAGPEPERSLRTPRTDEVASVNTHDMPPFAAYWSGLDIDARLDLGLIDQAEARRQQDDLAALRAALVHLLRRRGLLREETVEPQQVLEACLALLSRSPAPVVLVNLEDLWQETEPQNTPGTFHERANWRRKARYGFEEFRELPAVLRILRTVAAARTFVA